MKDFSHKKSLGQNFIEDEALLDRLAELSLCQSGDGVLEIGPGAGGLTRALAKRGCNVLALEIDKSLAPFLRLVQNAYPSVCVEFLDASRADLNALCLSLPRPLRAAANLPYYLTTPLLERLLSCGAPFSSIAVMVQKEAAARILAAPGTPEYGMLAVRAQFYAQPYIALDVPRDCFNPPPHVDSAFVVLPSRASRVVPPALEPLFFRVAAAAFLMRRKTYLNNLCAAFSLPREKAAAILEACDLPLDVRGERLTIAQFASVARAMDGE